MQQKIAERHQEPANGDIQGVNGLDQDGKRRLKRLNQRRAEAGMPEAKVFERLDVLLFCDIFVFQRTQ